MTNTVIVTLFSLFVLAFIAIGGIASSKLTTESTFLSISQTNWLRSVAILTIMFSHFLPLVGLTYDDGILSFSLNLGIIGVAIFFLLSGYSLMISKIKKPNYLKGFIKKRLVRLYVPFLIVYILDVIVMLIMGKQIVLKDILFIPLMSLPGVLNWYLKVQLGLYIVFYILARLIKNNNFLITSTFAICIIYMIIGLFTGITAHWYEGVFAFPLGMLIAQNKECVFTFLSRRYIIALIASIVVFGCCFLPYYIFGGTLFEILFIFGFLQFVVCLCAKFAGAPRSKIFTYLGVISLELYLVHTVINSNFISIVHFEKQTTLIGIVVLLCFLLGSIVVSVIVKRLSDKTSSFLLKQKR